MALIPAAFIIIMLGIYFVKHERTYPMIPILVSSFQKLIQVLELYEGLTP